MPVLGADKLTFVVCIKDKNGRILKYDRNGRISNVLPFRQPRGVRRLSVLSELKVGESGVLIALKLPDSVQNHLMHMGFVPDARVTVLRRAPAGDPTVYGVDGMEIALRHETAEAIQIRFGEGLTEVGEAGAEGAQASATASDLIEVTR